MNGNDKNSNGLELLCAKARLATELAQTPQLRPIRARLLRATGLGSLLPELLQAAVEVSGADFGNLQVANNGILEIAAQCGFRQEFLAYFKQVHGRSSACGSAMQRGARVIVEDVASDPIFAGTQSREVMLRAECRAVQSTPLRARSGAVLGMLSTHYRALYRPSASQLQKLDLLSEQASCVLEAGQVEPALLARKRRMIAPLSAAAVAHEINNPLQALTNVMSLLAEQISSEEGRALLAIAEQELHRIISLSQRLLSAQPAGRSLADAAGKFHRHS